MQRKRKGERENKRSQNMWLPIPLCFRKYFLDVSVPSQYLFLYWELRTPFMFPAASRQPPIRPQEHQSSLRALPKFTNLWVFSLPLVWLSLFQAFAVFSLILISLQRTTCHGLLFYLPLILTDIVAMFIVIVGDMEVGWSKRVGLKNISTNIFSILSRCNLISHSLLRFNSYICA